MRLLFLQMQHFRDVEIAKVRMEEKAKFHKEFDKLKQELERTHEMKVKALMDREKNAIDRLQKQQEVNECKCNKIISFSFLKGFNIRMFIELISHHFILDFFFSFQIEEKNVYMQRQSVLKEIETVRNREIEQKMRMEAFEK